MHLQHSVYARHCAVSSPIYASADRVTIAVLFSFFHLQAEEIPPENRPDRKELIAYVNGETVTCASIDKSAPDSDASETSTSNFNEQTVSFPNKLNALLNADHQQMILLRTLLVDESTDKSITVHQAFVLLVNEKTKEEIVFVAELRIQRKRTNAIWMLVHVVPILDIAVDDHALEFIIGDASLSNSFIWAVTDVELKFNQNNNNTRIPRP